MTLRGSPVHFVVVTIMMFSVAFKSEINAQIDVVTEVNLDVEKNMTLLALTDNGTSSNNVSRDLNIGDPCCGFPEANPCSGEGAQCVNCTCVCEPDRATKDSNGDECRARSTAASNVNEGALPLEFCKVKDDCITGLDCNNSVCRCPFPCKFVPEKMICDCGDAAPPLLPILLGCGLGFLICGFWLRMIMLTISSHESSLKNRAQGVGAAPLPRATPRDAAKRTNPPPFAPPMNESMNEYIQSAALYGYSAPPPLPPPQFGLDASNQTSFPPAFPPAFPPPYSSPSLPTHSTYPRPSLCHSAQHRLFSTQGGETITLGATSPCQDQDAEDVRDSEFFFASVRKS
ncbi:uncharacterized protein LOC125048018 [Penaeus chinensis]|uniref:uncharacterized protein LOC125048018 n=1 Tax=Penaeus chinensis TaxID=139456 RepID=UPI001FB7ED94|nr:uncharacterized protein LOC125048018 [Penaeus chinensis]